MVTISQSVGQLLACQGERNALYQRLQAITGSTGASLEAAAAETPVTAAALQARAQPLITG